MLHSRIAATLHRPWPWWGDMALAVPGCGWGLVSSSNVNEVVARTTPTTGQTGSASFTSSQTHTIGVATSGSGTYGSWSASGTSSITSGFEQTWATSSSLRDYRAQVTMGKYEYSTACGGGWKFQARFHTGGTSTATVSAPSYSNCASVSAGTWSRTSSSGSSHSLSAGLQASGVLGINLSASRQYSTTSKISYTQSGTKSVCGSNNVPSLAALVDGNP